jgi:predicted amidohydrolase
MSIFRVALLQLSPSASLLAAQQKGETFCRQAAGLGADLALFPEMWNTGYATFDPASAIASDDPFVVHFQNLAQELHMAIGLTYLQTWPGLPRNTVSLIDCHGRIAFTYAKVHTCDFDRESQLTPGDDFYVSEVDTAAGKVCLGAMICFDREFPESARVLMLKGAEIILVPNACEMEDNRSAQLLTRAMENMLGVALANYAGPPDLGHSQAYDGMAFTRNGLSRNTRLVEAGEEEGIFIAAFDLDRLRAWRKREAWGDAFRKPGRYAPLVSPGVAAPFKRKSNRR